MELNEFLENALGESAEKILTEPTVQSKERQGGDLEGILKDSDIATTSLLPNGLNVQAEIHSSSAKQRIKDKTI